jgi:phage gp36-like protein
MSTYCTQSDIEDHFGVSNVETWAKLETGYSAAQITARITRAIAGVGAKMDAYFRKGGYRIPVVDEDGETPTEVKDCAACLAGVWLYQSRGVDDMDRNGIPQNKLRWHYVDAMQFLADVRDGNIRINAIEHTG